MYTRYDRTDDNANAPINHATERSRMQRVVRNLLLDPMCEENSSVWAVSYTHLDVYKRQYLRSRYYNPGWGRFANADALIGAGKLLSHNRFAYCDNVPRCV